MEVKVRTAIRKLVQDITPHDAHEAEHIADTIAWIDANAPLFRVAKPDTPPKHLVVYFAIFDALHQSLLMVDHKLAGKLLPPGGHVENDEHPRDAALREAEEELGLMARFHDDVGDKPLFVTVTNVTNHDGSGAHTDVSLWYVLRGSSDEVYTHDGSEFSTPEWRTFGEILSTDITTMDPHMHRFVRKLQKVLSE